MSGEKKLLSEKNIHLFFDISLWLKGLFAISEIFAGIAAFFVTKQLLLTITTWVFQDEFAEDPRDKIGTFVFHAVQSLSLSAQTFAGIYLLAHGVIKLWLVVGLLRKKLWYYPTALIVFALFIVYQIYRYTYTHSIWLILITMLDVLVIGLTWHEYRVLLKLGEGSAI